MSDSNTIALSEHGTIERWMADCDCFDCRWAVESKIHASELVSTAGHLLGRMLEFRVQGCELYIVPTMIEAQGQYSLGTIRRHLDALVAFGALTKAAPIEGYGGRSGIYVLRFEKLTRRPILKMHDEFERLNETEGLTKATAWRVMMLREHETSNHNLCTRCGNFSTEYGDRCVHCYVVTNDVRIRCPVCQETTVPKAFFEPKMRSELERVETARTKFFQPRRLILVKG